MTILISSQRANINANYIVHALFNAHQEIKDVAIEDLLNELKCL